MLASSSAGMNGWVTLWLANLVAFGGAAPAELVPRDRIAPVSRRPSRRRSIRGAGLPKLRQCCIHDASRFGVIALAKRPTQTLRTEVAQLGHTLNGLQMVQQRYPLQEILLVCRSLSALANDIHHRPTDECRQVFRSLDIAGDNEECAWNSALVQQRDVDSKLVDAGIIERKRDAGIFAVLPLRDFGPRRFRGPVPRRAEAER